MAYECPNCHRSVDPENSREVEIGFIVFHCPNCGAFWVQIYSIEYIAEWIWNRTEED